MISLEYLASSTLLISRGPSKRNSKLLPDATGVRRKEHHAIAEARRLADVVRDEDDRLSACLPNALDVAVKLLASERIESAKGFIHQQNARIRCQSASEGDTLFHTAGELMDIGMGEPFELDKLQVVSSHLDAFPWFQSGL